MFGLYVEFVVLINTLFNYDFNEKLARELYSVQLPLTEVRKMRQFLACKLYNREVLKISLPGTKSVFESQ